MMKAGQRVVGAGPTVFRGFSTKTGCFDRCIQSKESFLDWPRFPSRKAEGKGCGRDDRSEAAPAALQRPPGSIEKTRKGFSLR